MQQQRLHSSFQETKDKDTVDDMTNLEVSEGGVV